MMQFDRLVRISKAEEMNLPFKSSTFYKWNHTRRFERLFVKFGRTVFIDLDELEGLIDSQRTEKIKQNKVYPKKRS